MRAWPIISTRAHTKLVEGENQEALRGDQFVQPILGAGVIRIIVESLVVVDWVQENHSWQRQSIRFCGVWVEQIRSVVRAERNELAADVWRRCVARVRQCSLSVPEYARIQVASAVKPVVDRSCHAVAANKQILWPTRVLPTVPWRPQRPVYRCLAEPPQNTLARRRIRVGNAQGALASELRKRTVPRSTFPKRNYTASC